MTKRVLILCTGNSCRSQMAEALWNRIGESQWEAHSAGSRPAGYVHPLAIQAMSELNEDLSNSQSKSVEPLADQAWDLVVTVCDSAKEACPVLPAAVRSVHWPFDDPADAEGSDEEKLVMFRRVRDQIRQRIEEFIRSGE
ncbi:MAG: arsenate reductase ArsC [Rubripirellula sp.]